MTWFSKEREKRLQDLIRSGLLDSISYDRGDMKSLYMGIDLTSDSIHLGHIYLLSILDLMSDEENPGYVVLGELTTRVGDPSERTSKRSEISEDKIAQNLSSIASEIRLIFPRLQILSNMDWWQSFKVKDLIQHMKLFSAKDLLRTRFFEHRLSKGDAVSLAELTYPILQAVDHRLLSQRFDIRGQLAGRDQRRNLISSLRLNKDVYGILSPLLVDVRGKKFSKSSSTQPFWKNIKCDHADFLREILKSDKFKILAKLQGRPSFQNYLKSIMTLRGCDFVEELAEDTVQIRGRKLPEILQTYMGFKNRKQAKLAMSQGLVKLDGREETNWSLLPKHGQVLNCLDRDLILLERC